MAKKKNNGSARPEGQKARSGKKKEPERVVCSNPKVPAPARRDPAAGGAVAGEEDEQDIPQEALGLDGDDGHGSSLGALVQLEALGPQNYFLDLHPQTSFFQQAYKRHTSFASECFDDRFDLALGSNTSVEVGRRGDVLGNMYLDIELPNLGIAGGSWADAIGYVLLDRVRLVVDDTVIHDQERLWYDLSDRLFLPHGRRQAVDALIGRGRVLATDRAHSVTVPLKFLCCTAHHKNQQFLPIAALASRARITVDITAQPLAACLRLPPGTSAPRLPVKLRAKLLSDQVFVDNEEKRAIMGRAYSLLMEEAQDVDALSYQYDDSGSYQVSSASLDLREVNLPVKSLVVVAYEESPGAAYFRYLDCVSGAVLFVNSGERFSSRAAPYFSLVQTYQHFVRCTPDLVHCYSFALEAGQRQPSGALNFAVLDKPLLRVELVRAATAGKSVKVKAFVQCVNWLVIDKGALSLRYTS